MRKDLLMPLSDCVAVTKALSTPLRIAILEAIRKKPSTVNEIADQFDLPASTAAVNIKKLEEAGLLATDLVPGTHGTKKICRVVYGRILIEMEDPWDTTRAHITMQMPVGQYSDCLVSPTCGLITESSIIGEFDAPQSFYEPSHVNAQLIWFRQGYLEYRFPNRLPPGTEPEGLSLTMEICSEAPMYNPSWPSNITLSINGIEVGSWTSPGDFGGERGLFTPEWWGLENTQYGMWKTWAVKSTGSYIDGNQISDVTLEQLSLTENPSITVRVGVKPDAKNVGGLNIFGSKMGNYNADITMKIEYSHRGTSVENE